MSKIIVAGLNGCLGSAFLGIVDALSQAQRAITQSLGSAPFSFITAAVAAEGFVDAQGRHMGVDASFDQITACDAIIIPPLDVDDAGRSTPAIANDPAAESVGSWMRRHYSRGALLGSSGAGVFALGAAGLLDGRRCTTSWRYLDELKQRWPHADIARGATLIDDRRVVTAGAPLAWIDVALHAIRTLCGAEAARIAADVTVLDAAPTAQSAYCPTGYLSGANPFLIEAERVVRQAGDRPLNAHDLARALSTSERTLHRKLKLACGDSPKGFIDRVRVETARTFLETSAKSVKELAASAGFVDEASFRRTFRRSVGMAPGAYRIWARARSHPKTHAFALQKDSEIIPEILTTILDSCVNGVTLTDPDLEDAPIIYANHEFLNITGYAHDEVIGRNCRFLQGEDREQEGRRKLREAIQKREHVEVVMRNYRKDGALFHNKLNITPLFDDAGRLIYFLGIQYDVTEQVRAEAEIGELRARLHHLNDRRANAG